MPSYLVEAYAVGTVLEDERVRARRAAQLGAGVRYLRTIFLPGDEMLFHVFEAPSPDALRAAADDAALDFERIVDAVESVPTESQEEER